MSATVSKNSGVRLAEVLASLSIATDLGIGQPMEFALSACILAVRLAKKCGYSEEALREVYYQALLRYIGCNAETDWLASIAGDEQILPRRFFTGRQRRSQCGHPCVQRDDPEIIYR